MALLGQNTKLAKSNGSAWNVKGLTLAPHKMSGRNVCAWAGACALDCVMEYAGRSQTPSVVAARIRKTKWFFENRQSFIAALMDEIAAHERSCNRKDERAAVRLNVASDLKWEQIAPTLFTEFPEIEFYDYSKWRTRSKLPSNYHLTYSVSERDLGDNDIAVREILKRGQNVALVCDARYHPQSGNIGPVPTEWRIRRSWFPAVDGDIHDIRVPKLDGAGAVVLLRFKGSKARKVEAMANGFCRATQ